MLNLKSVVFAGACLAGVVSTGAALAHGPTAAPSSTSQLIVQLTDDGMRHIQSVSRGQTVPGIWLPDGRELKFLRRFGSESIVVALPEATGLDAARDIAAQLASQPGRDRLLRCPGRRQPGEGAEGLPVGQRSQAYPPEVILRLPGRAAAGPPAAPARNPRPGNR